MSFLRKALVLFIVVMSAASFAGQNKGFEDHKFIVTTEWLANHLNDKNLVLIEIGDKAKYEKEHLPGAVFLQTMEISTPRGKGLTLQIPDMKKLIDTFEKAGVSDNSRIILYYGNDWVTPTARFYLTLDYMGLGNNTSILDGGLPQWKKENRKVTSEILKTKRGKITISNPDKDVVVDINYVEKNLDNPKVQIVDARTENFYTGADTNYSRPGHISGATNIPFPSITSEDAPYLFKSKEELKKIFEDANVKDGKSVICYCHIGQQASLVFFVAKYLGYDAHLYDGSYQEWDKRTDLPVIGAVKRN
ncbi:MAG TPA: sulfurtransferase [Ignavibacteriaceae bacterium]|nr:sulfurtransferase [Ignavibacteriaceae bacterium]